MKNKKLKKCNQVRKISIVCTQFKVNNLQQQRKLVSHLSLSNEIVKYSFTLSAYYGFAKKKSTSQLSIKTFFLLIFLQVQHVLFLFSYNVNFKLTTRVTRFLYKIILLFTFKAAKNFAFDMRKRKKFMLSVSTYLIFL